MNMPIIRTESKSHEIRLLIRVFNQLVKRTNEAFTFQKHSIQHISHQLKTPITVLVSELERIEKRVSIKSLKTDVRTQIIRAMNFGSIINALLEISKVDSGQSFDKELIRIDELIFEIINELKIIYPDFYFEVNYTPEDFSENNLQICANYALLKQAFHNVLSNSITYSSNSTAYILFNCSDSKIVRILISNSGNTIKPDEVKFLFDHFFRGTNNKKQNGSGLGLVLSKKIFDLHNAQIAYSNPSENLNTFTISLPLI